MMHATITREGSGWVIPADVVIRGTTRVTDDWLFSRFGVRDPRLIDRDELIEAIEGDDS